MLRALADAAFEAGEYAEALAVQRKLAALEDDAFVEESLAHNERELPRLAEGLKALGLDVINGVGNFVVAKFPETKGKTAAEALAAKAQKTGTPVHVPVPPEVISALDECPKVHEQYIFWSGNGLAKSAVADAQMTPHTIKVLRVPNLSLTQPPMIWNTR